jgi:phospholipase C
MLIPKFREWSRATLGVCLSTLLVIPNPAFGQPNTDHQKTDTPIKHVIVLIGENRTFDNLFATYVPKSGASVSNLLSKEIVNADGTPGPHSL